MNKFLFSVCLVVWVLGFTGCELFSSGDEYPSLTFENASRSTVTVYPLTTEWGAFSLAPTEVKEMADIRDTDYRFEPHLKVQEGSASTENYVIFVDAPPIEKSAE